MNRWSVPRGRLNGAVSTTERVSLFINDIAACADAAHLLSTTLSTEKSIRSLVLSGGLREQGIARESGGGPGNLKITATIGLGSVGMIYPEYYRARADEAQRKAMETSLPNVRTQYLKAAATWADMAERSERAERYRKEAPNPKVLA